MEIQINDYFNLELSKRERSKSCDDQETKR